MVRTAFRFTVRLYRTDNTFLGEYAAGVDWAPAVEWALLQGVRQGLCSPSLVPNAVIEPLWQSTPGARCVRSLRIQVQQADGQPFCREMPTTYLASLARQASSDLVRRGVLREGDHFRYTVGAYPLAEAGPKDASAPGLAIQEVAPPLPLRRSSLADFARESVRYDQPDAKGDLPVFLPQEVLDETALLSRGAGALETGGILIGHIHQDPTVPELFVEVTAQVPARHSRSERMRLTFTPETWAAAAEAIRLRGRGEIHVGWWHSHSFLKEPDETDQASAGTPSDAAFLSAEDVSLHRLCFPRAYSIALVVAEGRCTGLSWALFGWNGGMICPRGYQVLPRNARLPQPEGTHVHLAIGEASHA